MNVGLDIDYVIKFEVIQVQFTVRYCRYSFCDNDSNLDYSGLPCEVMFHFVIF